MLKKFVLGGMVVVAALLGNACGDDGSSESPAGPADSEVTLSSSSDDVVSSSSEKNEAISSSYLSSSSSKKAVSRSSSSNEKSSSSSGKVESSSSMGEKSSSSKKIESSSSTKTEVSSSSTKNKESSSSVKTEESSSSGKPVESSSSKAKSSSSEISSSSVKPAESSSSEYSSSSVIETSSSSLVATGVCKTAQEDNCVYDTLYDNHDGQTYKIVKIGEQWWMAENLRYVDSTQSVCYANNPDNCQIYGRLYDRNGALNNCPEGWRLPSEKDWLDLRDFAKKNSTNKYIGQLFRADTLWNVSELGVGYDAFGFGALPAGGYDEDGWWGVKTNSIFWLSDSYKIGTLDCFVYTRIRYKLKDNSDIQIGKEVCVQNPNSYFSVRCIKD